MPKQDERYERLFQKDFAGHMAKNNWIPSRVKMLEFLVRDFYIKPAVRMTHRSKWSDPNAQEYLDCKKDLGLLFMAQMQDREYDMVPGQTPMSVSLTFIHSAGHRADLDNIYKTVTDAANGIVYPDDRWIDIVAMSRRKHEDLDGLYLRIIYEDKEAKVSAENVTHFHTNN